MSERALLSLSLALAVGCSVPPSGLGRDVNEINRLAAEMEAAFQDDKFDAATDLEFAVQPLEVRVDRVT